MNACHSVWGGGAHLYMNGGVISLMPYPTFSMFSTGLQSIVNTELARIAVSSLHGMSWRYVIKSVWVPGSTPLMEAVKLSSESWVNTKTGLLTAHLHDDVQNLTFLQIERETVIQTAASATVFLCRHFVSQNGGTSPCYFNYRKFCCTTLPKDSEYTTVYCNTFLKSAFPLVQKGACT